MIIRIECGATTVIQTARQNQFGLFGSFTHRPFSDIRTGLEQLRNSSCNTSVHSANSRSNSFRCRCTSSTSKAETDGLPPCRLARSNATRFRSSHISAGRLIPVVRCVRSGAGGSDSVFRCGCLAIRVSLPQLTIQRLTIPTCHNGHQKQCTY